jgi:hypothetical protein
MSKTRTAATRGAMADHKIAARSAGGMRRPNRAGTEADTAPRTVNRLGNTAHPIAAARTKTATERRSTKARTAIEPRADNSRNNSSTAGREASRALRAAGKHTRADASTNPSLVTRGVWPSQGQHDVTRVYNRAYRP